MNKIIAFLIFANFFFSTESLFSQETKNENDLMISVSLFSIYHQLDGGFDGTSYYVTGSDIYLVPNIEPGLGIGIGFGIASKAGSMEICYSHSYHNYEWLGSNDKVIQRSIILGGNRFFYNNKRLKPFLNIGFGQTWIKVKNSYLDADDNKFKDGTYKGYLLTIGTGLAYFPSNNFSFGLHLNYNYTPIYNVKGKGTSEAELQDSVNGHGMDFYFSTRIYIKE